MLRGVCKISRSQGCFLSQPRAFRAFSTSTRWGVANFLLTRRVLLFAGTTGTFVVHQWRSIDSNDGTAALSRWLGRRGIESIALAEPAPKIQRPEFSSEDEAAEYHRKRSQLAHRKPKVQELERFRGPGSRANRWLPVKAVHPEGKEKVTILRESPFVAVIDNVFSEEECKHLMDYGERLGFDPSLIAQASGQTAVAPNRTSFSVSIDSQGPLSPIVKRTMEKISRLAGATPDMIEPMEILRYKLGQYFTWHTDWFPARPAEGQRTMTALIYLNSLGSEQAGGGTEIESYGGDANRPNERGTVPSGENIVVSPKRGRVLLFHNVDEEGYPEVGTLHRGQALVSSQEKYLMSLWFRERPCNMPTWRRTLSWISSFLLPANPIFHPIDGLNRVLAKRDAAKRKAESN